MNHPTTRGQVTEVLPDLKYRIIIADGKEILAYLSGKMKFHKIKVLEGDKVEVILDPYNGKATNRITRRV
jgi:translation initiation factor IF-1